MRIAYTLSAEAFRNRKDKPWRDGVNKTRDFVSRKALVALPARWPHFREMETQLGKPN